MKYAKNFILMGVALLVSTIVVTPVFANKAAVSIDAPVAVPQGTEITIKLNVTHHGNNWFHHVNWVYLKVNGEEVKRWEFSWKNRPESGNFTRTFTYNVVAPIKVTAEANCNLHGSQGPASLSIDVQ